VLAGADGPHPLSARRHPIALLALLATAAKQTLSRGKLVGLLWPDATEQSARNRLTSCVYEVRSALGAEALQGGGHDLRLNTGSLTCDVLEFEAALRRDDPAAAVQAYAGPLLDGFQLAGSAEFEQRIDIERDRLHWLYRDALEKLAVDAAGRGDAEEAVRLWRTRASDDPFDSRVAAQLVAALGRIGNRAEALRVAEHHTRLLADELGAEPEPGFTEVVQQIRTGAIGLGAGGADAASEARPQSARRDRYGSVEEEIPPRTVAVLPFRTLGGDSDAVLFAAGLHEDLLTELSRISALTVISRSSVERYREGGIDVPQVARDLGVGTVVHGAVRMADGRVRLTVQLIDARTHTHRWVERFDRSLVSADLFDVQGELAARIASTLRAELTPAELDATGYEPTRDLEAFALYTRGKVLLDQRTSHDMTRSAEYFRRAIDRDPDYALAWSGLAEALAILEFYRCPPSERAPDPVDAALRAVEKAPRLGQAHAALGIAYSQRRRGVESMTALQRAIELAPGYSPAHAWLGWLYLMRGMPAAALPHSRRSVELDPMAPAYHVYHAEALLANGRFEDAIASAAHARNLRPEYAMAHFMEGLILHHMQCFDSAAAAYQAALELTGPDAAPLREEIIAALAATRAALGDTAAARGLLADLLPGPHVFSTGLAHAALGDREAAFAMWERVTAWSSFSVDHLRYFFPDLIGPMRADARFQVLRSRIDSTWGAP
jgi:TolB-like protein/Flp pilus assembly protein TadD